MIKRTICVLFAVWMAVGAASAAEVSAGSAILYDADTHTIYFKKDADERRLIASTTKIMTALVALQELDMEAIVSVPDAATRLGGSSMYLKSGERLSVRELLYGLLLMSGNDAAYTLADACGGVEAFSGKMNALAQTLGLRNTCFANPHGLDDENNYSTARDMAVLAAYALENPDFAGICSCHSAKLGERWMKNHNKLLDMYDGTLGVKTGFTKAAGRCLVSAAARDGRRLICVTLHAPDDWNDHIRLYEEQFGQLVEHCAAQAGAYAVSIPLAGGGVVEARFAGDVRVSLFSGEEAKLAWEFETPHFFYGTPDRGAVIGKAVLTLDGIKLEEIELICG